MALKMSAPRQTLRELLVPGGNHVKDEVVPEAVGGITPPRSDVSSLSPSHSSDSSLPPSPEANILSKEVGYSIFSYSRITNLKVSLICYYR